MGEDMMKFNLSRLATALRILGVIRPLADFDEWSETFFHYSNTPNGPLTGAAVSGGTTNNTGGLSTYTGIFNDGVLLANPATANSGYRWMTGQLMMTTGLRTQKCRTVWRPIIFTNAQTRIGFHDATTSAAPVDGAWIDLTAGVATGKTANNSVSSTTGTSFNMVLNTAYTFDTTINAAGTLATFTISDPSTGAVLWTNTLAANLPTPVSTVRNFAAGIITTLGIATAGSLGILYYFGMGTERGYLRTRK